MEPPSAPGPEVEARGAPVSASTAIVLAGLAVLLVALVLEPYIGYAAFGSDTGEYYYLTNHLVAAGSLPHGAAYGGWGTAYPDFPGIFLLAGAGSEALGVGPFTSLAVIVPAVSVLSVLPLFLLFRRLYPNDHVALLASAVSSVAMPRLFSLAHPAPLALGDFLAVAALWMLVESRRDARWYVVLAPTSAALIVTHHLSSYFFAVGALGGIVFLELWRPGLWSRRFPAREFAYVAAFVSATFGFWFYGTSEFVSKVLLPGLGESAAVGFLAFEALGLIVVAGSAAIVAWRRSLGRPVRRWVRVPTDRGFLRDLVVIAVVVFGAAATLLLVPIPGTSQETKPLALLWFAPVLALGLLCSGSRRSLSAARLGPFGLTWLGGLGLSAALMLGLAVVGSNVPHLTALSDLSSTLAPDRHVEYLFLPLGLLVAVGTARLVGRAGARGGRRALVAASLAVVLLVAANAAIAYPPQAEFGGFEEGLTHGDAALWMWVGVAVPAGATVASDHRLSSFLFGFDGLRATWVTTPSLFTGTNWSDARAELGSTGVPNPAFSAPVAYVALDGVMVGGVALNPSALALPLSSAAVAWFGLAGFVPVYENAGEVVYLVDLQVVDVEAP
ncbi:MAG TPA: hypothetical protein VEH10_01660 [Thermoplasmata archaeon]|nr:hypothetical protein [Thermoplasmata archaeon]